MCAVMRFSRDARVGASHTTEQQSFSSCSCASAKLLLSAAAGTVANAGNAAANAAGSNVTIPGVMTVGVQGEIPLWR